MGARFEIEIPIELAEQLASVTPCEDTCDHPECRLRHMLDGWYHVLDV